ncbi:putative Histidine kinase [uncultured Desulfobacterium sp.]|uniref:histidine kinase n=1 Tax=uncultured Desulfobacterium sp. TaxID=201089 RepID=A0A445MZN3_9BACT|nr:putative Histidine kinase [uncultured Desulfobacterium sp.]
MLTDFLSLTNLIILAASFITFWLPEVRRKFSLAILQTLFFLPLLVVEYLAVALDFIPNPEGFTLLLASQSLFLVIWSNVGRRLLDAMSVGRSSFISTVGLMHALIVVLILVVTVFQILVPGFEIGQDGISFSSFSPIYFASVISLLVMLFTAWQLEAFWRQLPKNRRREYGLLVVGSALVCAVQGGVASYRLTYLEWDEDVLFLQAAFLLISWALLTLTVLRHRLLNRNLFISRKVVYAFVAPSIFAVYFIILGLISIVIRFFGYSIEWVLFWFLLGMGAVAVAILAVSQPIRQRLKFFISTHFYVNKYEFKDEWFAFSALLKNAHTETKVLEALRQVLVDSLYTEDIWIWAGSDTKGLRLVLPHDVSGWQLDVLADKDPIIRYIRQKPRLYLEEGPMDEDRVEIRALLDSLDPPKPVLFAPLAVGGQLVGCIGLGREYTGGRYGRDDFDLLAALGSQAASALLAVRLTEETARLREQRALHNLSVFLIHDIKNAASILSLIHANAQTHMDNPEFRKDMLIAIGDTLQRMNKVRINLGMLRDQVKTVWRDVSLCLFLDELLVGFTRRLTGLDIIVDCPEGIALRTDPQLLETAIENLLLNAYEANEGGGKVLITALSANDVITISIVNNGPAIPGHLLPDRLFQPFVSEKPGGSGIGLWQARLILQNLGATISADNPTTGGARFLIHFPLANSSPAPVDPASEL